MSNNINELQAPSWTLEDAYGSFTDERFLKRIDSSRNIVDSLLIALNEDLNKRILQRIWRNIKKLLKLFPL